MRATQKKPSGGNDRKMWNINSIFVTTLARSASDGREKEKKKTGPNIKNHTRARSKCVKYFHWRCSWNFLFYFQLILFILLLNFTKKKEARALPHRSQTQRAFVYVSFSFGMHFKMKFIIFNVRQYPVKIRFIKISIKLPPFFVWNWTKLLKGS